MWHILLWIASYFVMIGAMQQRLEKTLAIAAILYLVLSLAILISVFQRSEALNMSPAARAVLLLSLFAPCVNLLLVLSVNQRATNALRTAGLKVGLMGVRDSEVARFLGVNHCRRCGYNLTGNTSRRCPECGEGAPLPAAPRAARP